MSITLHKSANILGHNVFYREAGLPTSPTIGGGSLQAGSSRVKLIHLDAGHFVLDEHFALVADEIKSVFA